MNYTKTAQEILMRCGNKNNISDITHCTTRLRLSIKEKSLVDQDSIKSMEGIIGIVFINDELQIVLGKDLIPIYNEVINICNKPSSSNTPPSSNTLKNGFGKVIGFVSAAVTPMIPGLVAGGMLKVFLLLSILAVPSFAKAETYKLLSMLAEVPFYFMSVFVSFGAAKKLGSTPIYAMIATAGLVYPAFTTLLSSPEPLSIMGLPVLHVKYNSTLLPALLISICAYYCEKILVKIIPSLIRPVFVGVCTILISYTAGITILGPFGDFAGSYLVNIFIWPAAHFGGIAVGFLAACMPWLVMTGMHHAVTPFMIQAIATSGYDSLFRPAYLLHNMAEGGACIGVGLKTKSKTFRTECFSLAFGCIVAGVSEPAIYGINLRLKRPMYGVMAGGAAGGIVAGFLGATAYVYGYSTLLAVPIFQQTITAILAGILTTILVAAAVTIWLGFDETMIHESQENTSDISAAPSVQEQVDLTAFAAGEVLPLENIPDEMFSKGMLGPGCAIRSIDGNIYAPMDGQISMLAATKHAIGITSQNGIEILIHIGIDTVKLNGDGFSPLISEGDSIRQGQLLMTVDLKKLQASGYDDSVILIHTNPTEKNHMEIYSLPTVKENTPLLKITCEK